LQVKVPLDVQQQEFVDVPQIEFAKTFVIDPVQVQTQVPVQLPVMVPMYMTEQQKFVDVPLIEFVVKIVHDLVQKQIQVPVVQVPDQVLVEVPMILEQPPQEPLRFRVVVPQRLNKPISRIYCRRSMNKTDWHEEYVENDMLVTGHVEVDGDWLCLRAGCYLPMRFGELKVLEPMPLQDMLVEMIDHPS
jgi:hypothetical protein